MTSVLMREDRDRRKYRDTGKRPCKDEDRDWSDLSTSQGMPSFASGHQKAGERQNGSASESPEGTNLAEI